MQITNTILNNPNFHIRSNFPLKNITTIGVGGPAKYYSEIDDITVLTALINQLESTKTPFLVIGGGSNLLISDHGLDLVVIRNIASEIILPDTPLQSLRLLKSGDIVRVSVTAGTTLQSFVDFTIQHGLAGLQKLTGIPGSVGGAIYGNAGAYGQTISDHLTHTLVYYQKHKSSYPHPACKFSYRDSVFKTTHQTIISADFVLTVSDPHSLQQEADHTLIARLKKYPPGIQCPGSFFKNLLAENLPQSLLDTIPNLKDYYGKVPAWYFLEVVGAKGMSIGGARVSDIHANLIENTGRARAQDFYDLTTLLQQKVQEKFGITLEPEVQILGSFTC